MVQPPATFSDATQTFCRLPQHLVFLASALLTVALWAVICHISRQPGPVAVVQFLVCALLIITCTLPPLIHAYTNNYRLPFSWILQSALLLRLISLYGEPLFEDDHYRYMWDGYRTATTGDPYSLPPEAFFDSDVPDAFEPILSLINYPEIATVYGPVTEWIFSLAYLIQPAAIWPLQLLAGLSDVLVLVLLWRMGAGHGLLMYAWSPLILKEFSLTAHPDVHAIALVLLACVAMHHSRAVIAGIAIGLALGSKIFAVLVIPYLLLGRGNTGLRIKRGVKMLAAAAACLLVITLVYGSLAIWTPEGLRAMADSWLFNAPAYSLLLTSLNFQTIKILLLAFFAGGVIVSLLKRLPTDHHTRLGTDSVTSWLHSPSAFRGDWLFAAFVLALPVVNPWYVAWILPFAALYPRWWSWTAGYAVLLSYYYGSYVAATGSNALQLSPLVMTIEYAIIITVPLAARAFRRSPDNTAGL